MDKSARSVYVLFYKIIRIKEKNEAIIECKFLSSIYLKSQNERFIIE